MTTTAFRNSLGKSWFIVLFLAYMIPNNKSNIHPVLMGIILSILATKVVYGDYDKGYQWSINDIYFGLVVGGLGAIGAASIKKLHKHN